MEFKIRKSNIGDWLIYICIFLIGFQFQNSSHIYIFRLGILGLIYLIIERGKKIPLEFFVLVATFTIYFHIFKKSTNILYNYYYGAYWLGPIVGYLVGYCSVARGQIDRYGKVKRLLMAICSGTTAFAFACTIYKLLHMDIYSRLILDEKIPSTMLDRYSLNVWTNKLIQPTNLNSICIFSIIMLFYVLKYVKSKKVRVAYWISFGTAFLVIFTTATRTNLVILPMAFVVSIFFSRKDIKVKLTWKTFALIFTIVMFLMILSPKIIAFLSHSLLATRTESLDNGRIKTIMQVIEGLPQYPMGNMPYKNAHNMWVDVARVSGIIPMIFLIVYTVMIMWTLTKLIKNPILPQEIKTLFATLTICMLISFAIEPVVEGRPYNLMFFCMINGMCAALTKIRNRSEL